MEFAAAIERGDEEFTFPADDSEKAQKKIGLESRRAIKKIYTKR